VVPDLVHYCERFKTAPQYVALGFAAYLLFMRSTRQEAGKYYGEANGQEYLLQDEQASYFAELWQRPAAEVVSAALSNQELWGTDLTALPGFADSVARYLTQLQQEGASATLATVLNKNQRVAV
jgi:tagaturonate reductase